jgi:hypothetical protein
MLNKPHPNTPLQQPVTRSIEAVECENDAATLQHGKQHSPGHFQVYRLQTAVVYRKACPLFVLASADHAARVQKSPRG